METLNGAEIIVRALEENGVECVWGISGHTNISLLDKVDRSGLRFIGVRHEQVAAHAADAYFKASHKPAAIITAVISGLLNAATGVAHAAIDCTPMIVISGEAPSMHRGREAWQELSMHEDSSQHQIFKPFAKRVWRIETVEQLPLALVRAFDFANSGRPGPVVLSVPMDIFEARMPISVRDLRARRLGQYRTSPDQETIVHAVSLLSQAKRPLIYCGGGALLSEASAQVQALSEHLDAPVATTITGKGIIPEDHEMSLGATGNFGTRPANELTREADVVLAVGTRFPEQEACSWDPRYVFAIPPTKLIQIDIDAAEIGHNYPVAVGLPGDARTVLRQLNSALQESGLDARRGSYLDEIAERKASWGDEILADMTSQQVPLHPARVLSELREAMPRNGVVLTDVGWAKNGPAQLYQVYEPLTHISAGGLGTMGWSAAGALGAKAARPDVPVVTVIGDGGMSAIPQAIGTAVEESIAVIWLVLNDFRYSSIAGLQQRYFRRTVDSEMRIEKTGEPYNPDYVKIAHAYGASGKTARTVEELRDALRAALAADTPYLIDARTDPNAAQMATGFWDVASIFEKGVASDRS